MIQFHAFTGKVMDISTMGKDDGCTKMIALQNQEGTLVNFVLSPGTYVLNQEMLAIGDHVTGYFNANAPTIMIYPPQYPALVMVKENPNYNVKVSYFNNQLISQDQQLKLNIHPQTKIATANGQSFDKNPTNQNLIVIYGPSTKSIPAQTTPYQIIVLC